MCDEGMRDVQPDAPAVLKPRRSLGSFDACRIGEGFSSISCLRMFIATPVNSRRIGTPQLLPLLLSPLQASPSATSPRRPWRKRPTPRSVTSSTCTGETPGCTRPSGRARGSRAWSRSGRWRRARPGSGERPSASSGSVSGFTFSRFHREE